MANIQPYWPHAWSITHCYCYQCLFLEMRNTTIKDKNWFNLVIQQFADTIEQANQVCIRNWVSMLVTHSFYRLIQQQTGIWAISRLSNLNTGIIVYLWLLQLSVNQYPQSTVYRRLDWRSIDSQSIVGQVSTNWCIYWHSMVHLRKLVGSGLTVDWPGTDWDVY